MQKPLHVGEVMDGRRRLGTSANARHIGSGMASPEALNAASARPGGNERLYDTFRDLYCFKQASDKNFPSPAIVVLGTQGDGKSALLDSFMGFHLQGPGDQELRRPLTIQCKQNPSCTQPTFHLVNDDGSESEMSLESLREYLAEENARLESVQSYWSKEVIVRVEYKLCPNLTLVNIPGLTSTAPGKRANNTLISQQLEAVARSKMEQEDMKIVCVEGSKQWSDSHTLKLVLQVDPLLSRTVLVTMNLDWGSLSISSSSDVDGLLHPTGLDPAIECSPFLVSLPECCLSGHVSGFPSDLQFQQSVSERDAKDLKEIEAKIGRRLDRAERSRIGVEQLRRFLEAQLLKSCLEAWPSVAPMLDQEMRKIQDGLDAAQEELCTWQLGNLKVRARTCVEDFLSRLMLLMRGSVIASPEVFGQTLLDEHICGGKFSYPGGKSLDASATLPDAKMRLLGGAQFHRAMDEFRQVVGGVQCPVLTREEIANACGLEDFHDGANYMRTACTIAVTKAQALFEPFLQQLGFRLAYILRRLLPIAMQLLQKGNQAAATGHEALFRCVESEFYGFINKAEKSCKSRCLEDLRSTTRFVTWSLHNNGQRDMKAMLSKVHSVNAMVGGPGGGVTEGVEDKRENLLSMAEVLEDALWKRQLTSTSEEIVGLLVCQTFNGIRDYIVQAAELKFNCFFLMELFETFPSNLRIAIEDAFAQDIPLFDLEALRGECAAEIQIFESELHKVNVLQSKFSSSPMLSTTQPAHFQSQPMLPLSPSLRRTGLGEVVTYQAVGRGLGGVTETKGVKPSNHTSIPTASALPTPSQSENARATPITSTYTLRPTTSPAAATPGGGVPSAPIGSDNGIPVFGRANRPHTSGTPEAARRLLGATAEVYRVPAEPSHSESRGSTDASSPFTPTSKSFEHSKSARVSTSPSPAPTTTASGLETARSARTIPASRLPNISETPPRVAGVADSFGLGGSDPTGGARVGMMNPFYEGDQNSISGERGSGVSGFRPSSGVKYPGGGGSDGKQGGGKNSAGGSSWLEFNDDLA